MTNPEKQSLVTLCLMAAFADGAQSEVERVELERLAERLAGVGFDVGASLQDALMRRVTVQDVARRLATPDLQRQAYEMAVCICQADGALNDAERWFLSELRKELQLPDETAAVIEHDAQRVALPPVIEPTATQPPPPVAARSGASRMPVAAGATVSEEATQQSILNHALLAGGLELLPNSLATMAIIPLQMKLVYGIGKQHGFELDSGHVKDFLATVGVGLGSQVVEGFASRLITGLAGKAFGRIGRMVAGQATSSAFAFATTYALGQAARQYYAGGRRLGAVELKTLFDGLLGEGRAMQQRYLPQIREQAGRIRVNELVPLLTGRR